jgi:hypothetical protein
VWYFWYIKPNGLATKGENQVNAKDKSKLGGQAELKSAVKKIVAKEHQAIEYIGAILKDLLAGGHSQRSIVAEWSAQAGRTISQATVSQYVAIVESKSGANAQALLKAVQTPVAKGGLTVEQVRTLTPAKAKELELTTAPVRKIRTAKPKAKATANVVDQVKALRKAQAESARLDNATRAQLIEQLTNWVKALTQA